MDTVSQRRRKSVKLTVEEQKTLRAFRKTFELEIDCAESIGIRRETLNRVLLIGSASPENIEKIRAKISPELKDDMVTTEGLE